MMNHLSRITLDPAVMGGKPCIRGMRVTVGTIGGLLAAGHTEEEILKAYPYLERDDLRDALPYAAWRAEEIEGIARPDRHCMEQIRAWIGDQPKNSGNGLIFRPRETR